MREPPVGGSQLGCSLDGVQVVLGNFLRSFGRVEAAVSCNLDVLVVGNDLECDDDVHVFSFLFEPPHVRALKEGRRADAGGGDWHY